VNNSPILGGLFMIQLPWTYSSYDMNHATVVPYLE